jgi:hypothetical protein
MTKMKQGVLSSSPAAIMDVIVGYTAQSWLGLWIGEVGNLALEGEDM